MKNYERNRHIEQAVRAVLGETHPDMTADVLNTENGIEIRLRFDLYGVVHVTERELAASRGSPSAFMEALWRDVNSCARRMREDVNSVELKRLRAALQAFRDLVPKGAASEDA